MAHFVELDENNVVLNVIKVDDNDATTEQAGIDFLTKLYGHSNFKQCSFNTRGGKHYTQQEDGGHVESADQSKALRWNYPGIKWTYNPAEDAFIPPKPFASWTYNSATKGWSPPVAKPSFDPQNPIEYSWNEETQSWDTL